ncbi:MAG: glycosyltransferase family 9 protein [Planctomycetes bacterium]|nr:glycosyltransferase family 9 protein [Planctomycetota bacterium]
MARLLVIQLERLGDLIQTTPLLEDLHRSCPEDAVEILVLEETRPVLDGLPGIARVHALPEMRVRELVRGLRESYPSMEPPPGAEEAFLRLDLPHFDRVINLTSHEFGCWLANRIPAAAREGGVITEDGEWLSLGDWYVYLVARTDFRWENGIHVADLFRSVAPGSAPPDPSRRPYAAQAPRLPFSLPEGRRVALNPGSSKAVRRWPVERYARLADALAERGFLPLLVGAPADRELCAAVAASCRQAPQDFSGRTSVQEAACLLAEVDLLVSGDTGAVHLAAAAGTQVVGLYGGSSVFRETAPWGEGHLVLQAPPSGGASSMNTISEAAALAAALLALGCGERAALRREAAAAGIEAWETLFLPQGADPLGGIAFRPAHEARFTTSDLQVMVLRHVLAWELCGREGSISLAHLRELIGAEHVSVAHDDRRFVGKTMRDMSRLLRALAEAASEAEDLCYEASEQALDRVQALTGRIEQGVETLKQAAARSACVRPVIGFLDWTLRNLPRGNAATLFRRHERELERGAELLDEAAARAQPLSE